MSDPAEGQFDDTRGGVCSLSFLALVATQFFVSLNDNMFRWLIVPIGSELLGSRELAVSLGSACFILPFLVFAAPAGYLADRFSKRNVMVVCKVAEIVVISLGITAILLGNAYLMFVVLFLLGGQASMFITSKLGAIPELVRSDKIASANGVINMVSMVAIILGSLAGGILYDRTGPQRHDRLVDLGLGADRRCRARLDHQPADRPLAERQSRTPVSLQPRRANRPRSRRTRCAGGRCSWRRWAAPISGRSACCRK